MGSGFAPYLMTLMREDPQEWRAMVARFKKNHGEDWFEALFQSYEHYDYFVRPRTEREKELRRKAEIRLNALKKTGFRMDDPPPAWKSLENIMEGHRELDTDIPAIRVRVVVEKNFSHG